MKLYNYKGTWNNHVNSLKSGAIYDVDGSTDEEKLLSRIWTMDSQSNAINTRNQLKCYNSWSCSYW